VKNNTHTCSAKLYPCETTEGNKIKRGMDKGVVLEVALDKEAEVSALQAKHSGGGRWFISEFLKPWNSQLAWQLTDQ
jgi:hypothetical protein